MELRPGQVLSHFRIAEKIDEGGMGVVYRARDLHLERDVALKVLSTHSDVTDNAVNRFRKEALALSRLDHPNIAAVYDFDTSEQIQFLVMEWIPGITLAGTIALGQLLEREIIDYGDQITSGLGYAHGEGVIHRDIKPRNLSIAPDGRVRILDFGLAKLKPISDSDVTDTMPGPGAIAGTLPYIAPEVLSGLPASVASDIYAVGAVLYEMATGRRAFPQPNAETLAAAIRTAPPMPPRQINSQISEELEHVILRALEKKPDQRYESALELRSDLRRISSGLPLLVPRRKRRWLMPRQLWLAAALATALALSVLGLVTRRTPAAIPIMKPIATWPSNEWSAQVSPDAQWIAFLSDRGGKSSVWLQRVKGGEPGLLTTLEGIGDARWSLDGENIGVLVSRLGVASFHMIPAFGGRAPTSLSLPAKLGNATLVRWYGSNVYLDLPHDGVWRVDTGSGKASRAIADHGPEGLRQEFDVHPDENHVVYNVASGGLVSLWLADLSGGTPERLTSTNDNHGAHFGGARGDYVFFTSDRSGQFDLWRLELKSRKTEQITFSPSVERMQNVSDDASLLTFVDERDAAHLWLFTPATGEHRQLTAESVRDDCPSVARDRVVVQREKPMLQESFSPWNGEIRFSSISSAQTGRSWTHLADGGIPRLSPDGRRVAYARSPKEGLLELHVKDLDSGSDEHISDGFSPPNLFVFPRHWDRRSLDWTEDGTLLFLAETTSGQDEIRSWSGHGPAQALFTAPRELKIRELYPDGERIIFITEPSGSGMTEVHVLDRQSRGDAVIFSRPRPDWQHTLYVRGRLPRGPIVVLATSSNPDFTKAAAIFEIGPDGKARLTGHIDRSFAGTAELDRVREVLYFTGSDEHSVHNIFSFALADGALRRITNNTVPGISFAGFTTGERGDLLYTRQESGQDVWMIQFQH